MNISYNWLKEYIDIDLNIGETANILTNIGLEVEGIQLYESIKGGLNNVYIGKVVSCEKHPNADKLQLTNVDIGQDKLLNIVCGAKNIAINQHVVVATVGSTLHPIEGEPIQIKKTKIRGEVSEGMICAEDELGIGFSHEGIIVLNDNPPVGMSAKEYFGVISDTIFEIGLTPNRSDATSHLGVARDIAAYINTHHKRKTKLHYPSVDKFPATTYPNPIKISIQDTKACPRYTGLCISNVQVKESPNWLKDKLNAIGIRPINNVVDITQFILFEIGQPLHAFDANKITGNHVIIKKAKEGTPFVTLDEMERKLSKNDLMICNESEAMCMAGIMGGKDSGITENTTDVFLESAYFNPISIRKSSKFHTLKTDSSFRYERGCDPNITLYAIQRAALLIQELAGGELSDITDVYPQKIDEKQITINFNRINQLIGKVIDKEIIKKVLTSLEIKILKEIADTMLLSVPSYRTDVTREADIIEEILRIYGYNNVEVKQSFVYTPSKLNESPLIAFKEKTSTFLSCNGFYEIMNNSLTKSDYAEFDFINKNETISLINPLSKDLQNMRQTLLFGGLETIAHNINHSNLNLRLYEFGSIYKKDTNKTNSDNVVEKYPQHQRLSLFSTGIRHDRSWQIKEEENDFYYLKNIISHLLKINGFSIQHFQTQADVSYESIVNVLHYLYQEKKLISIGEINEKILKYFGIKQSVYYAEIDYEQLLTFFESEKVVFKDINKFPEVHRDLALLIDKHISYEEIEKIAYKTGKPYIKSINLFDVYEGKNLEAGKKSYAVNFVIADNSKTLSNDEINAVMDKLIATYEKELNAKLR